MSSSFPTISDQKQVLTWAISPDANALERLAKGIWDCALQTGQRPLVVLSTAGPLIGLRSALEKNRPKDLPQHLAFLPQVMSFADWLEAAPGAWKFPKKQSDLERWLSVYIHLRKHPKLKAWFKAESEAGAWGLAKSVIDACDILSEAIIPQLQTELNQMIESGALDTDIWVKRLEDLLENIIHDAYPELSRKIVDQESEVLLIFWRYLSNIGDAVFRKQIAMQAHLEFARFHREQARPLIWIQTADPKPIEHEMIEKYLSAYAQHAPVVHTSPDWQAVALWPEAMVGINHEGEFNEPNESQLQQLSKNIQTAPFGNWHLKSARRFEELAWAAAQSIQSHLIAGKTNIALVAQDRLAARRVRALLARLGPNLNIQDETGWKIDTTRAAAALNSWLELIRSPKEGPSAHVLIEFLQNPFLDIAACIEKPPGHCLGLVSQLEDILIASQAKSGWETFYMAIEKANAYARTQSASPNDSLLKLLQFIRARHHAWQELHLKCSSAYALLQQNLLDTGMLTALDGDAAGKQLLEVMKAFDVHASNLQDVAMRLPEWIGLVRSVLEEATYEESGKEAQAKLSILPFSSVRFRHFDAVVFVGCDEQHLPTYSEPPLFFSDTINRLLKTSTRNAQFVQQARDFSQLLVSCPQVDLLWQNKSNRGEPVRASAWIQRLQLANRDWLTDFIKPQIATGVAHPVEQAVTTLDESLVLPKSISPSAYKALRDCPYKFYVGSLLGLRKAKMFEEGFDASLVGQTLHALLRNFFQMLKTEEQKAESEIQGNQDARRIWMERELSAISEKEFKRLIEGDSRVLGALRDWQKQIPSFIQWQLQRESAGWRYHNAEHKVGFQLHFTDGNGKECSIRIEGRADRFDISLQESHKAEVIDYKNQAMPKIKKRAEHVLEDPQLLMYARAVNENPASAHLQGRQIDQAQWVALKLDLKKDKRLLRSMEVENLPDLMPKFDRQITEDMQKLRSRESMSAFAPDGVCKYCDARGICRKGAW